VDEKELKRRAARLAEVATILEKLPAEVRSAAFDLLKEYVTGPSSEPRARTKETESTRPTLAQSEADFFGRFDHDKPADNAKLVAAWFYQEYGTEPFSLDEIRAKANAVGITIPERLDMTFLQAKEKGKRLFTRAGKGKFKPTVHGEKYLKSTYSVTKGTQKRKGDTE